MLRFLHEEFPGRWTFEAEDALEKGKASDEVLLLWNPERTEVLGYCMLSAARDGNGTKTGYGGLGPIGIAKKSGDGMWEIICCMKVWYSFVKSVWRPSISIGRYSRISMGSSVLYRQERIEELTRICSLKG